MPTNAYALAFEQAIHDLSWIDRELERLNAQQKQLTELLNCLKLFVPDVHASMQEHAAPCEEAREMADSQASHAFDHHAAGPEMGEPAVEHQEQLQG